MGFWRDARMSRRSVVTSALAWGIVGIALVSFWYEFAWLSESYLRAVFL
jgi:hypothetical protein